MRRLESCNPIEGDFDGSMIGSCSQRLIDVRYVVHVCDADALGAPLENYLSIASVKASSELSAW